MLSLDFLCGHTGICINQEKILDFDKIVHYLFLSFTFVANKVWSHFRHENKYLMSFIISCLSHNRGFQIIYMNHDICSFLTRPLWNTPLVTYSREAHIGHERQTLRYLPSVYFYIRMFLRFFYDFTQHCMTWTVKTDRVVIPIWGFHCTKQICWYRYSDQPNRVLV